MTTLNRNFAAGELAEVADFLDAAAQEHPVANTTVNFSLLNISPAAERKVEDAAEMVRRNGGIVAYTRSSDGVQIQWNRFKLQATNSLAAWFFREIVEINEIELS